MALTFDIMLGDDHDLPHKPVHGTSLDLVLQRIEIRLRRFLGEWLGNTAAGLPYLAWMATKPVNATAIGARVRAEVQGARGVQRTENWSADFNRTTRTVSVSGDIVTEEGQRATVRFRTAGTQDVNAAPWLVFVGPSGRVLRGFTS